MSNQITATMYKIASFLNLQPPFPSSTTTEEAFVQQIIDPIEERAAIEKEQVDLNEEQARISQEMEQCQSKYQKNSDLLDALFNEQENMEDQVEALYMKLYCSFHWIPDAIQDDILQEGYLGSNEVYNQLCHQKCDLERRLADMDNEIERLDLEKGEIQERKEALLVEQLALDLEKEHLDVRKRSSLLDSKALKQ